MTAPMMFLDVDLNKLSDEDFMRQMVEMRQNHATQFECTIQDTLSQLVGPAAQDARECLLRFILRERLWRGFQFEGHLWRSLLRTWPRLFGEIFSSFSERRCTLLYFEIVDFLVENSHFRDAALAAIMGARNFSLVVDLDILYQAVKGELPFKSLPSFVYMSEMDPAGRLEVLGTETWRRITFSIDAQRIMRYVSGNNFAGNYFQLALMCAIGTQDSFGRHEYFSVYAGGSPVKFTQIRADLISALKRLRRLAHDARIMQVEAESLLGSTPFSKAEVVEPSTISTLAAVIRRCQGSGDFTMRVLFHLLAVLHDLDIPVYVAEQIVLYTRHSAYAFLGGHTRFIDHAKGVYESIEAVRDARLLHSAKRIRTEE
jgi:hypothetical protein